MSSQKRELHNNKKIERKTEVSFIDAVGSKIKVEAKLTYRNGYPEFTMTGEGGGGIGQNYNEIKPATKNQKKLLEYWEAYHLKEIDPKIFNDIAQLFREIAEENNIKEYTENDYKDISDNKVVALALFLSYPPEKAKEFIKENQGIFYTVGNDTYMVCTDDEATAEIKSTIEDFINEVGVDALNVDKRDFVDSDWAKEVLRELKEKYIYEIDLKSSPRFKNRLIEKMYQKGILTDEDFMIDDKGKVNYFTLKPEVEKRLDLKKDEYIEYLISQAGDPIDYIIFEFGEEYIKDHINKDKLIDYVLKTSNRGEILNSWDGIEYEVIVNGTIYYIYR
jgi:hypothetical protein